jgi:hypothetical protein
MRLADDWKWIVTRSWSVRFIALAFVLTALETILPFFMDNPPISRFWFAVLVAFTAAAAFVARLVAQDRDA